MVNWLWQTAMYVAGHYWNDDRIFGQTITNIWKMMVCDEHTISATIGNPFEKLWLKPNTFVHNYMRENVRKYSKIWDRKREWDGKREREIERGREKKEQKRRESIE